MNEGKIAILYVCMGNICRSPTAEGVMQSILAEEGLESRIRLDSAGTHAYHLGEQPDRRAITAAAARGIDIGHLRARLVEPDDFLRFDYVLAMDADNLARLERLRPATSRAELSLLLAYSQLYPHAAVPDPYYGGDAGFERVLDMLEEANRALLAHILGR